MKTLQQIIFLAIICTLAFACQSVEDFEDQVVSADHSYVLVEKGDKVVLYPLGKNATLSLKEVQHSEEWEAQLLNAEFSPKGVVVKDESFDIQNSLLGREYHLVGTPNNRVASSTTFVLSGIEYPEGTYSLINGDTKVDPVYNGNPQETVPEGIFELFSAEGVFVMQLAHGTVDLQDIAEQGLQGLYEIRYRLFDESQGYESVTRVNIQLMTEIQYSTRREQDTGTDTGSGTGTDTGSGGTEEEPADDPSEIIVIVNEVTGG